MNTKNVVVAHGVTAVAAVIMFEAFTNSRLTDREFFRGDRVIPVEGCRIKLRAGASTFNSLATVGEVDAPVKSAWFSDVVRVDHVDDKGQLVRLERAPGAKNCSVSFYNSI